MSQATGSVENMSSTSATIHAEAWRASLGGWVGVTMVGFLLVSELALVTAPAQPLGRMAEWVVSSAQHVEWTAPTLIAAAFALAAICAAPVESLDEPGTPKEYFAWAAQAVSGLLTVWLLMTLVSLFGLGEVSAPRHLESFARVSGLILCAPLGIAAGLSAGRFTLAPLERRLAAAERGARAAHADIVALGYRFSSTAGLRRLVLLGVPTAIGVLCVAFVAVSGPLRGYSGAWLLTLPTITVVLYSLGWSALAFASILGSQPPGRLWRPGSRRRPTRLGLAAWIGIGIVLVVFLGLTVVLAISFAVDPETANVETGPLWGSIFAPIIGFIVLAVHFIAPPTRLIQHDRTLEARKRWRLNVVRSRVRLRAIEHARSTAAAPPFSRATPEVGPAG